MPKDIAIIGLSNYRIEKIESNKVIEVYAVYEGKVSCHYCMGENLRKKDSFWRRLKHISLGNKRSHLIVRSYKYHCLKCFKYFNLRLPGTRPRMRSTEQFRKEVYFKHHKGITQKTLAEDLGIGQATVERWYQDLIRLENRKYQSALSPRVLGIDEHFFTRKQGYATTFADLTKHKVYDVVLGRSAKSLESYLSALPGKTNTKVILMDLSETYRSIAKKHFPRAKIVADRFHVVRLINQRFLETWKILDEEGRYNRGLLSLMRRHEENLSPEQRKNLYNYFEDIPGLRWVYEFKQDFMRLILTKNQNKKQCRRHVKRYLWLVEELRTSSFKPLQKLGETMYRWREEIVRMFRFRKTNSITEGLHNKMEMITRRAFGFRNFKNYKLRVKVHCS